eukprot:jgi/Mesen1/5327/ME000266S04514
MKMNQNSLFLLSSKTTKIIALSDVFVVISETTLEPGESTLHLPNANLSAPRYLTQQGLTQQGLTQQGRKTEAQVTLAVLKLKRRLLRKGPLWVQLRLLFKDSLIQGIEAQRVSNYQHASLVFQEVLEHLPGNAICLRALASMAYDIKKYKRAIAVLKQAVRLHPRDLHFRTRLGEAYAAAGKSKKAVEQFSHALELNTQQGPQVGYAGHGKGKGRYRRGVSSSGGRKAGWQRGFVGGSIPTQEELDAMGPVDLNNPAAGDLQGAVTMDDVRVRESEEVLRVLLRIILEEPDHAGAREKMALVLQDDKAMKLLKAELCSGADDTMAAKTFGFLANMAKDYGAVKEAVDLYRLAVQLAPSSSATAHCLLHTLEACDLLCEALLVAKEHLQLCADFSLASVPLSPESSAASREATPGTGSTIEDTPQAPPGGEASVQYSDEELDALAMLCSLVKLLYLGGALARASALAVALEPLKRASRTPLHETLIRNEAAYASCLYEILQTYPVPVPLPGPQGEPRPLLLAGDSHCLAPAWRRVHLRGQERLVTPLLVTGLKAWHLRDASVFYPKVAFWNVMNRVPRGSQLIMLFGEIDCREGIINSVRKGRYSDLKEGAEATVAVYMKVLLRLIEDRDFEIFVHPVPAVLAVTKRVVGVYNVVLRERVAEAALALAPQRLHWLDFFNDLVSPEGLVLPEYELDGAHMNPTYVPLLDRELSNIPADA